MLAEPNPHEIAVCTVVRDDGDLTRFFLALDAQSVPNFGYDLVLVDATPGGTLGNLDLNRRFGVEVVRVEPDSSPGAAWNAGWRAAHGTAVAFLGPAVLPQPMWLAFLLGALRGGRRIACGRWLPTERSLPEAAALSHRLWAVDREALLVTADQLGCWRADLEEVGGFAEDILDPDACALDLAARLVEAGVAPYFERRMVCEYDIESVSLTAQLAARRRATRLLGGALAGRGRARRGLLAGGIMRRGPQAEALLAVAGLGLMIENLWAAILVIPWLHHRTHVAPHAAGPRRKWFVLPGVLGVDLYDAFAGLAAQLRSATRP